MSLLITTDTHMLGKEQIFQMMKVDPILSKIQTYQVIRLFFVLLLLGFFSA